MKKSNKVLLVIVLILVILFGVGQFFAFSNPGTVAPNSNSQSPSTTPSVPPTNVIAYEPGIPATSTPIESGSCWTNSISAAYRTDAWRCTVGNSISDPCFEIQGSKNLLCNVNPAVQDSTSSFVLKLTQPLPAPMTLQGTTPLNWAWLVELQDGTFCSPFTGTRPFTTDGQTANYDCAPGPLGPEVFILGDLNASTSAWVANVATLVPSTSTSSPGMTIQSSEQVPVATVWQ